MGVRRGTAMVMHRSQAFVQVHSLKSLEGPGVTCSGRCRHESVSELRPQGLNGRLRLRNGQLPCDTRTMQLSGLKCAREDKSSGSRTWYSFVSSLCCTGDGLIH